MVMALDAKWSEVPSVFNERCLSFRFLLTALQDNTNPLWYKDSGLRHNVALGLGLCLTLATNVGAHLSKPFT